MMIGKCPECGYSARNNKATEKSKADLLKKRHIELRMAIASVSAHIRNNRLNDNKDEKELQFLSKIENISDDYIYKTIKKFMGRKLHLKGYGFDYLFTMINSESNDKEKSKKNEKKMIGSNPPVIKVKE